MTEYEVLDKRYPGAIPCWDLTSRQVDRIRSAGGRPKLSVYGACLCSDELCAEATGLPAKLPGPFALGGLAGLPHTGRTGFAALGHHVPEHGTCFVLYGPHVGIDDDGRLGYVRRPGQSHAGPCCGSAMLALSRFSAAADAGRSHTPSSDPADAQQAAVELALLPFMDVILAEAEPVAAMTEVLWELIHERVMAICDQVKDELHGDRLVLCGGVMIHLRPGEDARFQVRHESL